MIFVNKEERRGGREEKKEINVPDISGGVKSTRDSQIRISKWGVAWPWGDFETKRFWFCGFQCPRHWISEILVIS